MVTQIPLFALIFQGIPECIAWVTLAFAISKKALKWNKIIFTGVVLAVSSYLIRQLPIPFGLHVIVNLILLFITLLKQGQVELSMALISCLSSLLALIIAETVSLSLLTHVGLSPNNYYAYSWKWILLGEPHVLILFGLAYLLRRLHIKRGQNNVFFINQ